jgi:hypothetical protein
VRYARVLNQPAEGYPGVHSIVAGDPSLRLKDGCAQDDAIKRSVGGVLKNHESRRFTKDHEGAVARFEIVVEAACYWLEATTKSVSFCTSSRSVLVFNSKATPIPYPG